MARTVRRRKKQRIYWVEIGFLILGLIALRPSLVSDVLNMGRNPNVDVPPIRYVGDYRNDYYRNDPGSAGVSSYYPVWNQPSYPASDPLRSTYAASSNVAWPDAQVHQFVHNGASGPLVASPSLGNGGWSNNNWNNNPWTGNSLVPYSGPNRYPTPTPVYTGRY
jgi:hypothetical protein